MAHRHRHISGVAGEEVEGARLRLGGKHRHPPFARNVVLPFVGVRMPVDLPHVAGIDLDEGGRHIGGDREVSRIRDAHASAGRVCGRLVHELEDHALRNSADRIGHNVDWKRRRRIGLKDEQFLFWYSSKILHFDVKIFCQHAAVVVSEEIRNRKGAVFGKLSIGKRQ